MRAPRTTGAAAAIAAALALVLGPAPAAFATPPPALGSDYVYDDVDALTAADEAEVNERLARLADDTGLDLWVVYVDAFTDPADAADWANEAANRNGLGPHQYLLAIAIDETAATFYLSGDVDDGELSADQLSAIERDRIQPRLEAADDAGAALAAADGIRAEQARAADPAPAPADPAARDAGIGPVVLVVLLLAAIGGGLLWFGLRRRRRGTGAAPGESVDDLARRAGSALVATDDAVTTSEQELGFARAQFGDEAAAPFVEVLARAKADLDRAFSLQQQLDDDIPETVEQRRAGYVEILRLCAAADESLDAKTAAFDDLRALEADAPAAVARAGEQHTVVAGALAAAEDEVMRLGQRYADDALAPIADNPDQARARLDLAAQQLEVARAAIARGETGGAAVAIRAAQAADAQADTLQRAVTTLSADLAEAEQRSAQLTAEIEADITTASALPDPDGRVGRTIAAARAQLDTARAALTPPRLSPLRALSGLEAAHTAIDNVVRDAQDAAERQRRAAAQLDAALLQARAQVSAGEDFVSARRGAVGPTARTRLAEARAALAQAEQLRTVDPSSALASAQCAAQMAGQAGSQAQNDVGAFRGGSGGGDVMGAVLGGIALNAILGGGSRSRGGFGGGGFGGGFGAAPSRGFGGGGRARSGGGFASRGGGRSRAGGGRAGRR